VGRHPKPAAEHAANPRLHYLADLSASRRAQRERRLRRAISSCTTFRAGCQVLCVSKLISFWRQGGRARHGVHGGQKCSPGDGDSGTSTPRARSGSGAELRTIEVGAGTHYSNIVAVLACGMVRHRLKNTIRHAYANGSDVHTSDPLSLCSAGALFK